MEGGKERGARRRIGKRGSTGLKKGAAVREETPSQSGVENTEHPQGKDTRPASDF